MAITYCAGNQTDGFVDEEFVEEKVPAKRDRDRYVSALVDANLWHVDANGWRVHDFLDRNPSKEETAARRDHLAEVRAEAGRRGAKAKWDKERARQLASNQSGNLPDDKMASSSPGKMANDAPDPTRPVSKEKEQKKARQVDQDALPDGFPRELTPVLGQVMTTLLTVAAAKGSHAVSRAGVAKVIASRPRKRHALAAVDFETWWLHGQGSGRSLKDVAAAYRNWLDNAPDFSPAADPQSTVQLGDRILAEIMEGT